MYIKNLNEIKEGISIEEVLSYFNHPNQKMIICPFHQEKTPSFSVSEKHNKGTCFGSCGRSWSPIDFIMEHEQLEFVPAVELAAQICNIQIEYAQDMTEEEKAEAKKELEKRQKAYYYNRLISEHYYTHFIGNIEATYKGEKPVETELAGRNLKLESIEHFGLCRTPDNYQFITEFAQKLKLDFELLKELGWIGEKKDRYYDKLSNRVLFPIRDKKDSIVGFTARALSPDQKAKYLNSPENLLYKKSELWYGLSENHKAIRTEKKVYIVEGSFDLLSLYDYGIENVIASCGTSISEKQLQPLKKIVVEVCLLYDGDQAGLKAIARNIPTLLSSGLKVSVLQMPEGEDPDSYIRSVGKEEFQTYIKTTKKEAIHWYLNGILTDPKDAYQIQKASNKAVELLMCLESETLRLAMVTQLVKSFKLEKRLLLKMLKERSKEEGEESEDIDFLDEEQRADLLRYGIYQAKNAYYSNNGEYKGTQLSNFVIKPLFHIKSKDNPKRLFELVNVHGQRAVLDIDTSDFVSADRFVVKAEAEGNFLFKGNSKDFLKLKAKVYDEMDSCYQINTLGQHHNGFYAFSNGLYLNKAFHPVDEFGIVELEEKNYFLPAFSEIYQDETDMFIDDRKFKYQSSELKFKTWAKLFHEVHGDNGKIAMLFFMSSLFRDIIYKQLKFFPHLNLFGQKGSGKSYMAWGLSAMFGEPSIGFNLHTGTQVGFFNRFEVAKNNIVWFDEYKNGMDHWRVEFLKGAYDGAGRERGQKTSRRSLKTRVNSACIISGQELPTIDNALLSRVITLEFKTTVRTESQKQKASELSKIQDTGELSSITARLLDFRMIFEQQFAMTFEKMSRKLVEDLKTVVESRILSNMAVLCTTYELLKDQLEFPFSTTEFLNIAKAEIVKQSNFVSNSNEMTIFWETVDFMVANNEITIDSDFKIENANHIKIVGTDQKVMTKAFPETKMVIYLSLTKIHPLYMEAHRKRYNKVGLAKTSMLHYLKNQPAFLGTVKSKRIGDKNTSCFAFDYDILNLSILDLDDDLDDEDQKFFEELEGH